jgi:tetratricopeptide (TPR) repeat protein
MSRLTRAEMPSHHPGWPARSGTVPPLAECFSPRPETGLDTARDLAPGGTVVLTQPAHPGRAGSAMGGTGKTQLAAALARSLWASPRMDLVAWVPAASRDAVMTGYAQASVAAGLHGDDGDTEAAADSLLAWLADTNRPWLVVLDDLADQADLDGLWPAGPAGLALITTRLPAAEIRARGQKAVEITRFSPREALSFLAARLNEDPGMRSGALDLATDVGCLPLGLALAAALIADSRIDCARYRAALADRKQQFPVPAAGEDAATAAAAWSLALERADYISPPGTAAQALALVALLGPAGIPGAVLTSRAACDYICGQHATGTLADESRARSVLDGLARVGLVTIDPESPSRTVLMHGLVQATIRQAISPSGLQQAASAAADALLQSWPPDDEPLTAQAQRECAASLDRAAPGLLWAPEAHPVLLRAGQSLDRTGLTGLAIPYWQAVIAASQSQDRAQAIVFPARDHLAAAYLAAGHTEVAIGAYEENLAEQARALGADHPGTLRARGSLARALLRAGRERDAIAMFERTLADRERSLGPDHPDTLASRGDLVEAYLSAGRARSAVALLERTYRERAAALGPGHPDALAACAELASALPAAGQIKESLRLHEHLLAERERALGATHPETMNARASLAYAYRSADRLKQALPVYERTLADREKVLGPDHPDTLTSLANLASAYHSAHRLKQALPLYEEALERHERLGGPDHAETLVARGNLASAYHSAGRLPQAISLYEQTLQDYERLMGPDHTNTLTSRANLASAYHTVGRRAEAIGVLERTLADCERVLPADHPMTRAIRENLQAIE